jgi:sulfatase maturation enzyme AslB (radical SAM superfamily)
MPPNHLAVYLSNRCNLQCKYCYVAVNQGPTAKLTFEHLKANMDYFFSEVPPHDRKITFLGGEPFIDFPLLQKAVDYARDVGGPDAVLQTFTNGTAVTKERMDWLDSRNVHVTLSLDGKKATNDRNRVFHGKDGSVFDEAMKRLEGIPKDNLGVSLVFDSYSVGELLQNVDYFYRMGFARITFNPELYEIWSPEKLAVLRAVMRGFTRYYSGILKGGMRPFTIPILFSVLEKRRDGPHWWHDCHNFVLGPDDKFYSCDKALTFTLDKAQPAACGDAKGGMDWAKRKADLDEARRDVDVLSGEDRMHYFCPMGVVFYSKLAGTPHERLLENFNTVSGIFGQELEVLIDELKSHPTFQALYEHVQRV